jgi:hypothetical protein
MAFLNNHRSKLSDFVQLGQKAGQRIKQASQFASTIKGIYDNGRMLYNVGRTIAPYRSYRFMFIINLYLILLYKC